MRQGFGQIFLVTALIGTGVYSSTAGARTCAPVEAAGTGWQVLVRLDLDQPSIANIGSGAPVAVPEQSGGSSEVETYIRFHQEAAAGDAWSRLMPWPGLRSLAQ